jgi:hypothetical protein
MSNTNSKPYPNLTKELLDEKQFEQRLIANAIQYRTQRDELLDVLKRVSSCYDDTGCEDCGVIDSDTITIVREAIVKATQSTNS